MNITDLIVIILSHERLGTMKTVETLKRKGFDLPHKILIDSNDKEKEGYINKFGDKVIVYDKSCVAKKTDLMNNFNKWNVATLARNYALEWARENGYKYLFLLDDDLKEFNFCYDDVNSKGIIRQPIKNINNVISAFYDFIRCSEKIMAVGFGANGMFFGGKNGSSFSRCYERFVTQCFMIKTDINLWFTGQLEEDYILSLKYFDKIALDYFRLSTISPATASNKGGGIIYTNMYEKSFYQLMFFPSGYKIYDCVEHRYIEHIMPKVIREIHKKI